MGEGDGFDFCLQSGNTASSLQSETASERILIGPLGVSASSENFDPGMAAEPQLHYGSAPRILIVDDHAAVRAGLKNLVASRPGWVICGEAADGEQAVSLALELKPSAIVMDVSMPKMDGLEATRRIRKQLPDVEIVIVSQHDSDDVVVQAQRAGARGFVVKSHLSADLLPSLEAALRHNSRISAPVSRAWQNAVWVNDAGTASFSDPGPHDDLDLMSGGGEMGALMRAHDWAKTPFGPVSQWPQSLRTALRICLDSRFPIVIWWGPELRLLYNDAWRPALGTTKHPQALGSPGREVWSDVWDTIGPMLESVMRTGKATWENDQLLLFNRHGYVEESYWTYSYSAIRLSSGEVGGVFSAVHEVTDRVLNARRLRTLREVADQVVQAKNEQEACSLAMQSIVRNPADCPYAMIFLCDGNQATRVAASFAADAVIPSSLNLFFDDKWGVRRAVASRSAEVFAVDAPDVMPRAPFGDVCRQAISIPILGATREPVAIFTIAISPYRELDSDYREFFESLARNLAANINNARAYDMERKRAEALAELDRAKTAFFSNVSHEFRTPLTLMLGPLEDVLSDSSQIPPGQREKLEVAQRNSVRLLKLVNSLLDFSRIEAGRVQASFEPVNLATVTAELASVFRSAIERAGLQLKIDCPQLPDPVFVDREMWEKVILNLLSNAFKFTFQGEISVLVRSLDHKVVVSIRDTGIGIPESELPRLFERFHRVEGAKSRSYEGSGIGLALVRELVHQHGGQISVNSELGKGTTFSITLLYGTGHLPQDRIQAPRSSVSTAVRAAAYVQEAMEWIPGEQGSISENVASQSAEFDAGVRILLADDNADMRSYITRLLSPHWHVETVADGNAALQRARQMQPTLVITDVMMPGLDGFGLLAELRKDPVTCSVPVLMLSARAGEESRVEGLQAGANDYIVKPFSARELVARVASQINLRKLSTRLDQHRAVLAALFRETPLPIVIYEGEDLVCISENPANVEALGGRSLLGKPLVQAVPEMNGRRFHQLLVEVMRTGKAHTERELQSRVRRSPEGEIEESYWTCIVAPFSAEPESKTIISISVDVTEQVVNRRKLEALSRSLDSQVRARTAELEKRSADLLVHSGQIRELSHRLLQVQDEERRRIARDLHDSAGQTLTALSMNLYQIAQAPSDLPPALAGLAAQSEDLVQQLIREIRTSSYLLHPPLLDERGLGAAVRWYLEGLKSRSDLDVTLEMSSAVSRLPAEVELVAFRVLQECLTNIHRHSGSKSGTIRIEQQAQALSIEVVDQGVGIPPERLAAIQSGGSGVGIRGMRERLAHIQGTLEIESDSRGTRVRVTIPIPTSSSPTPQNDQRLSASRI